MLLQEKVTHDWKEALKARDPKKDVLSLIRTELKNKAINTRSEGQTETLVDDETALGVLQKMAKQRKESIESYEAGGRQDLAEKEAFELGVIEFYLPKQLSDEELHALISSKISELGISSIKDIGKLMGAVLQVAKGRADGKKIQEAARVLLSGNV